MRVTYTSTQGLEKTASLFHFQRKVVTELIRVGVEPDEVVVPLDDAQSLTANFDFRLKGRLPGFAATLTFRGGRRVKVSGFIDAEEATIEAAVATVQSRLRFELQSLVIGMFNRIGLKAWGIDFKPPEKS